MNPFRNKVQSILSQNIINNSYQPMTAVSLRQLRYLETLARTLHFGRAAAACAVSQPALSMQIKALEQALGVVLVERRRGEAVRLTAEGREVVRRARQVLLEVRDLQDFAAHSRGRLEGPLALGVIPTVAPYLLPQTLPLLQRRFPGLLVRLRETRTAALVEAVAAGDLDLAILALPAAHPRLESLALFDDPFVLVTAAGASGPGTVRVQDLRADTLLLLEEGHCLRDQALALCGAVGPEAMRFGATSLATILQMVAAGYGATLVPEMALDSEVRPHARLRVVPFAGAAPSRTIGLAWREGSPRGAQYQQFGAVLQEAWRPGRA